MVQFYPVLHTATLIGGKQPTKIVHILSEVRFMQIQLYG